MTPTTLAWVLPDDTANTGKAAGGVALTVTVNGVATTVYVPAGLIVDGNGQEIGSEIAKLPGLLEEALSELKRARVALEELAELTEVDPTSDPGPS